jgi:hypothetical protein
MEAFDGFLPVTGLTSMRLTGDSDSAIPVEVLKD